MHNCNFSPKIRTSPAHVLASPECAHAGYKGGMFELYIEGERCGPFEFVRTVCGETVGDPRKSRSEHRNRGRIGAKMSMDMLNDILAAPIRQHCCFHQIAQMPQNATIRAPANF